MTVSTNDNREEYVGNGSTTVFGYAFKIFDEADLEVYLVEGDVQTRKILNTDYTVSGAGNESGGNVTMMAAPTADQTLVILRVIPIVQETDLRNQGRFYPETIEDELDRSRMIDQQLSERLGRSLIRAEGLDHWDAGGLRITNLGDAMSSSDAVNKGGMEEYFKELESGELGNTSKVDTSTGSGQALQDALEDRAIRVATVADLPATGVLDGAIAIVDEYSTGLGFGGGMFVYDPAQVAVNDGGLVIDGWVRRYTGDARISFWGVAEGGDITNVLATADVPIDGEGRAYTLDAVERTSSLYNIKLTSETSSPTTYLGSIVSFVSGEDLCAEGLSVVYTGPASGVRGIAASGGTHRINLRYCYVEGTSDQGIRVQGCDDPDLSYCRVYNCYTDAIGSSDVNLAYGAIAIFGGTAICNRARLIGCQVDTQSSGISLFYGSGHVIRDCRIDVIDPSTVSPVSMGIYCGGLLQNLLIDNNRVGQFANEGIDVHNTGGSSESGIRGITICNNYVDRASYFGISVVSEPTIKILDANIYANTVINQSEAYTFGFSGGIIVVGVLHATVRDNVVTSSGGTPIANSYGLSSNECTFLMIENNCYRGPWDQYERIMGYNELRISGSHGDPVAAGKTGILISQTKTNAITAISDVRLILGGSGAVVLDQPSSSQPLSFALIQYNYLNGLVNLNIQRGMLANNLFRNFGGTITLGTEVSAINNPGWMSSSSGTTKTSPGTVDRWVAIRENGNTYYIPAYLSKTS